MKLINDYNLSYAGWNLSNKSETSALISPGCDKTSDWNDSDLSETGKWLKDTIGR
jgi:endoglucanase